jgi:hypothetical protein
MSKTKAISIFFFLFGLLENQEILFTFAFLLLPFAFCLETFE